MKNNTLGRLIFSQKFLIPKKDFWFFKKLPTETQNVVWIQILATFSSALAGIFVNIFLWRQAQNFTPLVIFNFSDILFIGVIYITSAYLFQRRSSAFGLRMGLLLYVLFFLGLLVLGEKAIFWVIPLGCLKGVADGFYWSGLNLLQYVFTHDKNRDFYFGAVGFWTTLSGLAGPIIGGGIIALGQILAPGNFLGYYFLFLLASVLFTLTACFSFRLKRLYLTKFSPKAITFSIRKSRSWRLILGQQFLIGFYDVSLWVLIGIFTYLILANSEFFVGTFQTSLGIIGALASLVAGKVIVEKKRIGLALLGALGISIGSVILGFWPIVFILVLAGLIKKSLSPLLQISLSTLYFRVMDEDIRPWQEKYDYMIVRDTVLGVGRLSSYLILFFLFEKYSQMTVARGWIIIVGLTPMLIWVLVWLMGKGKNENPRGFV